MNRPRGVTLLAGFFLTISLALFVLTAAAYRHPELLLRYHIIHLEKYETVVEAAGDFILFAPMGGCMLAVIGVGLLALRKWARWTVLLSTGITLFQLVVGAALGFVTAHKQFVLAPFQTIPIVFNAAIVFYLTRPSIKAAFGEGTDARI